MKVIEMEEKIAINIIEGFKDFISSKDHLEVASVIALFQHLEETKRYKNIVDFSEILKAEDRADEVFKEILSQVEVSIPYFKGVFSTLSSLKELEATQVTQLFYYLTTVMGKYTVQEWYPTTFDVLVESSQNKGEDNDTPISINQLIISILDPKEGTFYDGAMGYGGTLLQASQHNPSLSLYGQEIQPRVLAIAKIRLFINGNEDANLCLGDALLQPAFTNGESLQKFDYVAMNSPLSMRMGQYETIKQDEYNQFFYGLPSRSNADYAFLSHLLASLKSTGRAVTVVTEGTLFRGGREGQIRSNIIAADLVEAVVALPAGLFRQMGIPVSLLVLNKNKETSRKNKILFVKANEHFTENGRRRYLTEDVIQKIADVIQHGIEERSFSKYVHIKDLVNNNLNVSRYVLPEELTIEGFGKVYFNLDELEEVKGIPLKEVATFFTGYNLTSKNKENDNARFKIVRLSDVEDGQLLLEKIKRYEIKNNAKVDTYKLKKGDVVLSIRGTNLKTAVIPVEDEHLLLSQNFIGIRCSDRINPYFLKTFLESPLGQYMLLNQMSGTAIPTLKKSDVANLEIPEIPIEKQQEIMEEYLKKKSEVAKEIEALQEELKRMKSTYREQT